MLRNKRILLEWLAIVPIFLVCANDLASAIVAAHCEPLPDIVLIAEQSELITPQMGEYELYWRAVFTQIAFVIFGFGAFIHCMLIKACRYTMIAVSMFLVYEIISLIYAIIVFDYDLYLNFILLTCTIGFTVLITTFIFSRWIGRK